MRILNRKYRKTGAPIIAVIAPTGMPLAKTRATTSAPMSRNAPKTAEQGMSSLDFEPTRSLETWGITRPTNPMDPEKLTAMAVQAEIMTMHSSLVFTGSTPSD